MAEESADDDVHLSEALEDFVLDSEIIRNLEAEIGGFNVFEAIGHTHAEERHSDFLTFLMDPQKAHGLDDEFLKRFLQEVLKNVPRADRPLDLVKLSITDLGGTTILREHRNIDVFAVNDQQNFVVVIENKVKSSEHSGQLQRYREYIEGTYPSFAKIFVYLTPDASEPSDLAYVSFGYESIAALVAEILQTRSSSLAPAVKIALEHYLEILQRHVVSDPKLTELAQAIYQKHKTALDFIFEQKMDLQLVVSETLKKIVEEEPSVLSDRSTKGYVNFVPKEWERICALKQTPMNEWTRTGRSLLFEFRNEQSKIQLKLVMGPTENEEFRERVYALCKANKEIFKGLTDKVYPKFMTLYSLPVLSQAKLDKGDLEEITSAIREKWDWFLRSTMPEIEKMFTDEFKN